MPTVDHNSSETQTFAHPILYRLVQGLLRVGEFFPGHYRPEPDWLERQALRITGQERFVDTAFREPLQILLRSAREQGGLNAIGRAVVAKTVLSCLVNRLSFEREWGGARPRSADPDWPFQPPLYLVGLPRTGTTLLHKLLSADPQARPLLFWEAMFPTRLPEKRADAASIALRQSRAKQAVQNLNRFSPGLSSIHDIDPAGPEECYLLLANTFHSFSFPLQWPVRDYYHWLSARSAADWRACYEYYVDSLRVLSQGSSDRHWVLKCPFHAPRVDALAQLVPNAIFIQTYRDIREIVASTCSLSAALRSVVTDHWNPNEMGAEVLETLGTYSRESTAAAARQSSRVISIHYRELVRDPLGTVRRVYEQVGLSWNEAVETPMRAWLAANPQGKHGRHRYALEDFGLTADQVMAACPEYMEVERHLAPP
jgi:hypothetical protein